MIISGKLTHILKELKVHAPFTILGASTGLIFMLIARRYFAGHEQKLFAVFHPLHVLLSAMVTAALFEIHRKAKNFCIILLVGITGSIGIATLSDCILPFFGEEILGVAVPTHADLHQNEESAVTDHEDHDEPIEAAADTQVGHIHDETCDHAHHSQLHLGFIEEWYLVFPAAIIGIALAYFYPHTKYPHATHVLVSTWASSSHILMNTQADLTATLLLGMFIVLFIAVWLPCCVSDIVFPLLWVRSDGAHIGHCCVLCGKEEKSETPKHAEGALS